MSAKVLGKCGTEFFLRRRNDISYLRLFEKSDHIYWNLGFLCIINCNLSVISKFLLFQELKSVLRKKKKKKEHLSRPSVTEIP